MIVTGRELVYLLAIKHDWKILNSYRSTAELCRKVGVFTTIFLYKEYEYVNGWWSGAI